VKEKIDFVITWVDESDALWKKSKDNYALEYNMKLNDASRYRDWGFLKYWFRSVEKNAPWVNRIYFVTEGHLPEWLDLSYEKLKVIKHSDFIDENYLPTFNSNVIELNFSKLPGLSEHFVSFNDDMFLNKTVYPSDFFKKGFPKDIGVFSPVIPLEKTIDSIVLNNVEIINRNFSKSKLLKNNFFKFFNLKYKKHFVKNVCTLPWNHILGFYDNHIPISYKKSIFEKVYKLENDRISNTLKNRFRTKEDISHWLIRYWQICEGKFYPRSSSFGAYYNITQNPVDIVEELKSSKHKVICLNDNDSLTDYEKAKKMILREFEKKYNDKSRFER